MAGRRDNEQFPEPDIEQLPEPMPRQRLTFYDAPRAMVRLHVDSQGPADSHLDIPSEVLWGIRHVERDTTPQFPAVVKVCRDPEDAPDGLLIDVKTPGPIPAGQDAGALAGHLLEQAVAETDTAISNLAALGISASVSGARVSENVAAAMPVREAWQQLAEGDRTDQARTLWDTHHNKLLSDELRSLTGQMFS